MTRQLEEWRPLPIREVLEARPVLKPSAMPNALVEGVIVVPAPICIRVAAHRRCYPAPPHFPPAPLQQR
eukprot:5073561-Pleurochrysis_carterae.AAC.1